MRLVPLRYTLRSLVVRWSPSLFSALGIGLTVAVLGGVLALREGFRALLAETGREDVVVFVRPGAQSEGESIVRHPLDSAILKTRPEIAVDEHGVPLAAIESYLGLKLAKIDGSGTTIVTVRGVEPQSIAIQGKGWRIVDGRAPRFGAPEVVVGKALVNRIQGCQIRREGAPPVRGRDGPPVNGQEGDAVPQGTLTFNVMQFTVVGVFECDGPYGSEIWGDVEVITKALKRDFRQRLVAQVKPGTDVLELAASLEKDKQVPVKAQSERAYFASQTTRLAFVLDFLARVLTSLMGAAAVLGAVNTMLAAVGARTREVGILVALGYRPFAVFLSFLLESAVIGVSGGALGTLLVLPFNGLETSTTNWNTFTEVAFAFRVTPEIVATSVVVAAVLGVLGGTLPALRAARMRPTIALRRL